MAAAAKAAKADLLGPLGLCKTATPQPASGFTENYNKMKAEPPLEPMQVMDDLYFLGNYWTSAWAVKTSKGIVILDALDNADEAQAYIEDGLKKLKLDPTDIKYVIVSHAHGDHYGGAAYLKKKFNAEDRDERHRLEGVRRSRLRSQAHPAVRRAAEARHGGQ